METRKCKIEGMHKTKSSVMDSAEDDLEQDPYHDLDGERDPNFELPVAKKPRINRKRIPLRQQRIKQLQKRIREKYSSNQNIDITNSNHEHLQEHQSSSLELYDDLLSTSKVEMIDDQTNSTNKSHSEPTEAIPSTHLQMNSNPVFDLISDLQGQISELNNNVMLLRKQVSRVELKTIGWPVGSDGRVRMPNGSQCPSVSVDSDDLLDFESLLAREGLPIATCVELNELELKLRNEQPYRTQLVRIS